MTQEEKELLLKDLCARLPYGVVIHTYYNKPIDIKCTGCDLFANTVNLDIPNDDEAKVYVENVRPYLRPMSSMTEEERTEWMDITHAQNWLIISNLDKAVHWLNAHHFDFRGLIERGLAIEAPENMYKMS